MDKKIVVTLSTLLVLAAAAAAVALVLLFSARSDIDDLQTKVANVDASLEVENLKGESSLNGVRQRVEELEKTTKANSKAADPDDPLLSGNVSLNDLLKTVNQNADTANENIAKIEGEVSRLKDQLSEESQVEASGSSSSTDDETKTEPK